MCALLFTMGGDWSVAKPAAAQPRANVVSVSAAAQKSSDDLDQDKPSKPSKHASKDLTGKLNLNTATEDQLQLLPTDLRRVKGFGYKTLKKLEPYLDIKGETTLSER